MSDATFLDNQEVTAEDLNNIAIDLGYPDYSHFPEETPPSAVSALNQITADLVSAGVLLTGNRCAVTYSNGNIYVDTGIIVFESGAKKRIESMQQLQAVEGTSCVYALNNTAENTISLVCASEFPTDGDFVKLGIVTDGIVVNGTPTYSVAKVALESKAYYKNHNGYVFDEIKIGSNDTPGIWLQANKTWEFETPFDQSFTHVIFTIWPSDYINNIFKFVDVDFSAATDEYVPCFGRCDLYVKKADGKLIFKCGGNQICNYASIQHMYFF